MEKKKSVVIADNSAEFCQELTDAVNKSADLTVTGTVFDGEQAIELVRQQQPDVLVLDLLLPKLDGIGVLKKLSDMEQRPAVIATSGFITDYMVSAVHGLGVEYLMLKPLDAESLVQRIEEFTSGKQENRSADPEVMAAQLLFQVGVPANVLGYRYAKEAILIAAEDMDVINAVSKVLYPAVARRFQTTPSRVDGAIRQAIEIAWDRGDLDTLQRFFGYTVSNTKGKPTNSEFIALLADRLQLRLRSGEGIPAKQQVGTCSADDRLVAEVLHEIGVPAHIKGYLYMREAILLAVADGSIIHDMTKKVYSPVAKSFSTTPDRVRRAMAHAIAVAWDRGDLEVLWNYFGDTVSYTKGMPTASEFVAMVSEKIRLGLAPYCKENY